MAHSRRPDKEKYVTIGEQDNLNKSETHRMRDESLENLRSLHVERSLLLISDHRLLQNSAHTVYLNNSSENPVK